jgi:hypothetical protein
VIVKEIKERNPYPLSIFPEPKAKDWDEIGKFLLKNGKNPDRIFAKWGRMVWENCADSGIARVIKLPNGKVCYWRYKSISIMDEIKNAVLISIQNYRNDNLRKFDGIFRMSKFSAAIDAADQSILSNITTFKIYAEVTPKYNIAAEYRLNIVNPIYNESVPEESFTSTGFYLDNSDTVYYMDDDGSGNVRTYSIVEGTGTKIVNNPKIGAIDYANGVVKISGLKIVNLVDANFYFIIKTQSFDVVSLRNYIVNIPDSRISISVIPDTSLSGITTTANNYTFTSSRN